jgi:hypothetical protein
MKTELPEPIAAYFAADRMDGETVARCFTASAVVKDEGHTYTGLAAIKRWKTEASARYNYTAEPLDSQQKDNTTIVTSQLTGRFPGSPVTLRFVFRLERGKISLLEITP